MEPYFVAIFLIVAVFLLCFFCTKLMKGYSYDWGKKTRRRKWNKYVKSHDPNLERRIKEIIKSYNDSDFNTYLKSVQSQLIAKYDPYHFKEHTRLKRSVYNVVRKFTNEIKYERLKLIEEIFPMVKRVYFGPRLNSKVYAKNTLNQKFRYKIKSSQDIPQLDSIIDVARFLNTTVNKLLGLCYMQDKTRGTYYVKQKKIHEAMKRKNPEELNPDIKQAQLDPSYNIPVNFKPKKEQKSKKATPDNESIATVSFLEENSPFYKRKFLIKPDGRKRLIADPVSYLKKYQRIILEQILEKAELPEACTGFMKNKSILSNALNHVGAQTVVKVDLRNFFNSMKFHHVFEVFRGFGYSRDVSGVLACICTDWYGKGGRYVPQGAPSSPMIGNLYAMHLDKRLEGLWSKKGFKYSRYADDLTFSSTEPKIPVRGMIHATYKIIRNEKLFPNQKKTKVLRKQHKKTVTGITVNEKINIDRKWLNNFRGDLYRYAKFGLPKVNETRTKIYNQLQGKMAFLNMVNPEKAEKYNPYLQKIKLD